ncbi:hypothetical protein GALL_431890 [mine drainage metagenome]|uniref:Uncharacterized protein n=1 Tax=mine drainage metagenome TaxID=410659 RepID=A0A1J5Q576_9ZZZZ
MIIGNREHLGDLLVRLEREQVCNVLAARITTRVRQFVRLGTVDPTFGCEEEDPIVGRTYKEGVDDVVLLQCGTTHALAAAALGAVQIALCPLGISTASDGYDDIVFRDQILCREIALSCN